MGNIGNSLKRFLGNKNTVTIIGVILGVLVLYMGYNWRVNQAVTPVSVPYARQALSSRELITEDMIGFVQVPQSLVNSQNNLVTSAQLVVGQRVAFGTTIPENSLFYREMLMSDEEMPDSAFAFIPDGYTIYALNVNLHTTFGNSIFPGNFIDLYLKAINEVGLVIYGRFIQSIEVLAVKDSQGRHVFETTAETRQPAVLLFAVPNDMYLLLEKAGYITGKGIEIRPVPRNAAYSANPGETLVSSEFLRNFILAQSLPIPDAGGSGPAPQVPVVPEIPTVPEE